ncbi:MAG: O-antigen ligase family protein [Lachnospiraceae bacterium]
MQKRQFTLWDMVFIVTMVVTILAVNFYGIREGTQLLFIVISLYHIQLRLDMTLEFILSRVLFLLWSMCSFSWALYPEVVLPYMVSVAQSSLLVVALVIYLTDSYERVESGLLVFVGCTLILVVFVLNHYPLADLIKGNILFDERITVRGINANQVGVCCSYSAMIVFFFGQKRQRILRGALIVMFSLVALITGSKKAFITLLVGMFLLILLKSEDVLHLLLHFFLAGVCCVGVIWMVFHVDFLFRTIGERLLGMLDYLVYGTGDKSTYSRGAMIDQARTVFLQHPFLGIGLHNFKQINVYGVYAHNNYWELLVCLGIPGFLMYYIPFLTGGLRVLKRFFRQNKKAGFVCVMMLCFLINEYATVSYTNEVIQIILALILSMTCNADCESGG